MQFCFTAAAERALAYGSDWSSRAGGDELEAPPLLLGLLCEPECRAAVMLAQVAVDRAAVLQRWPGLTQNLPRTAVSRGKPLAPDVELSLRLAEDRLAGLPRPLELATEHILLGLAVADHEMGRWLRERGLDPDRVESEIRKLYGCETRGEGRVEKGGKLGLPEAVDNKTRVVESSAQTSSTAVLRVLDAAANRAREGLRVIEDYVRFVLDDGFLTDLCKQLRHDLTGVVSWMPAEQRLAARETQGDVGTTLSAEGERRRDEPADVLAANFARLQESLRSLEEFGKIGWRVGLGSASSPGDAQGLSESFKQLRYRAYTLHRAVEITRQSIDRLGAARLCVLVDGGRSSEDFERLVKSLIAAGVGMIQLRDKRLSDRELIARARTLRAVTRGTDAVCIVNDRPDIAALAAADGIHVGQDDATVKDARRLVGPASLVGVSTHSIEQARQAVLDGANYIGVGPTFPSGTKTFSQFPGLELLRAVAAEIRLPAFAIGGIGPENLANVLDAGATRIAVSGAVTRAEDPAAAARHLAEGLTIAAGQRA